MPCTDYKCSRSTMSEYGCLSGLGTNCLNGLIRRTNFIPAYLFSLSILILASLPGDDLAQIQRFVESPLLQIMLSDPFMHFLVFGLLALLICRGFYSVSNRSIPFVKVTGLSCGYGLFIEVYQAILPWRSFGLDDLFWNTLGVLFFLILIKVFKSGTRETVTRL